jgi:hypothetical protein
MPLSRALRRIACVAGLAALCGAGAVRAEDTPPTEDWIGAVSVDRFTDASWRIAAGRAQGDRGSVFELRLSCRRDGDRRDIAAEIFVFGADAKPLDIAWDYARDTGRAQRRLRWRLDTQPAGEVLLTPAEFDNGGRIEAWSWARIEVAERSEERGKRANVVRQGFFSGLAGGRQLLIGDVVEGEVAAFRLPGGATAECPLCAVLDDCLRTRGPARPARRT